MRYALAALSLLAGAAMDQAKIHTQEIEYKHGDVVLQGYLAYDDSLSGKRAGVLIVHEWTGHNPYVRKRAEQLAELGYVAFALDMYGKGGMAKDATEAAQKAGVFKKDRALMRARATAGLEGLKSQPNLDPTKIGGVGSSVRGPHA